MFDQPTDRQEASQRPPPADHVDVDVGAVAGQDVVKVLFVGERQRREVEQGVALAGLGPVDDAGDLVIVDEDVGDLQVAVCEDRRPRSERSLGDPALARRTWVLLTEAAPGGWGLWGHAHTNEELVVAARAEIASLKGER